MAISKIFINCPKEDITICQQYVLLIVEEKEDLENSYLNYDLIMDYLFSLLTSKGDHI